jgi:hypothetical protein
MTVDRCQFIIRLYQGNNKPGGVDFSHGVVAECMRITGNVLSFHKACRAVLNSALGQSTGEDKRKSHSTSVLEFRRLQQHAQGPSPRNSSTGNAAHAMEHARELLAKDRLGCQRLGMESLVGLTDMETSGDEVAMHTSLQVLQEPWLFQYLLHADKEELLETVTSTKIISSSLIGACTSSLLDVEATPNTTTSTSRTTEEEDQHAGILRSCALRVLCNALDVVSHGKLLEKLLSRPNAPLTNPNLLAALVNDLKGANRPVMVAAGTRLASAHEAALAVRCLRVLGEHSEPCKEYLQTESVLACLEMARTCGRSTHQCLYEEAESTYSKLTEDVRSC